MAATPIGFTGGTVTQLPFSINIDNNSGNVLGYTIARDGNILFNGTIVDKDNVDISILNILYHGVGTLVITNEDTEEILTTITIYFQTNLFLNTLLIPIQDLLCKKCKCVECSCNKECDKCIKYQNLMNLMNSYLYNIHLNSEQGTILYSYEIYTFLQDSILLYNDFIEDEIKLINLRNSITGEVYYSENLYKFYIGLYYLAAYFFNRYSIADLTNDQIIELDNSFRINIIKKCLPCEIDFNDLNTMYQNIINPDFPTNLQHNNLLGLQGGSEEDNYYGHLTPEEQTGLDALLHKNLVATISVSPITGERGVNTNITLSYNIDAKDDIITTATITTLGSVLSNVGAGTISVGIPNIAISTTYTLTITGTRLGNSFTETYQAIYTGITPQWYGTTLDADLSNNTYTEISSALNKVIQTSATIEADIQPVNKLICWISNKPNAVITNSGFPVTIGEFDSTTTEIIKKTFILTLANGITTSSVTLYRTREVKNYTNPQTYKIT